MAGFMSSLGKVLSIFGASALATAGGYGGYSYALAEPRKDKEDHIIISSSDVDENLLLRSQQLLESGKNSKDKLRNRAKKAIKESKSLVQRFMTERSIPGLVIGVSFKGHDIWVKGFGFSNIEQGSKCKADTVMRI